MCGRPASPWGAAQAPARWSLFFPGSGRRTSFGLEVEPGSPGFQPVAAPNPPDSSVTDFYCHLDAGLFDNTCGFS